MTTNHGVRTVLLISLGLSACSHHHDVMPDTKALLVRADGCTTTECIDRVAEDLATLHHEVVGSLQVMSAQEQDYLASAAPAYIAYRRQAIETHLSRAEIFVAIEATCSYALMGQKNRARKPDRVKAYVAKQTEAARKAGITLPALPVASSDSEDIAVDYAYVFDVADAFTKALRDYPGEDVALIDLAKATCKARMAALGNSADRDAARHDIQQRAHAAHIDDELVAPLLTALEKAPSEHAMFDAIGYFEGEVMGTLGVASDDPVVSAR